MSLSKDGLWAVSGSTNTRAENNLLVWSMDTGTVVYGGRVGQFVRPTKGKGDAHWYAEEKQGEPTKGGRFLKPRRAKLKKGERRKVVAVAFNTDGEWFVTADFGGVLDVWLWDAATCRATHLYCWQAHGSVPEQQRLEKPVVRHVIHTQYTWFIRWEGVIFPRSSFHAPSPTLTLLCCTYTPPHMIRVFVFPFPSKVSTLAVAPDKQFPTIVTGGHDGEVKMWRGKLELNQAGRGGKGGKGKKGGKRGKGGRNGAGGNAGRGGGEDGGDGGGTGKDGGFTLVFAQIGVDEEGDVEFVPFWSDEGDLSHVYPHAPPDVPPHLPPSVPSHVPPELRAGAGGGGAMTFGMAPIPRWGEGMAASRFGRNIFASPLANLQTPQTHSSPSLAAASAVATAPSSARSPEPQPFVPRGVTKIQFSETGRWLAVAREDNTIRVWGWQHGVRGGGGGSGRVSPFSSSSSTSSSSSSSSSSGGGKGDDHQFGAGGVAVGKVATLREQLGATRSGSSTSSTSSMPSTSSTPSVGVGCFVPVNPTPNPNPDGVFVCHKVRGDPLNKDPLKRFPIDVIRMSSRGGTLLVEAFTSKDPLNKERFICKITPGGGDSQMLSPICSFGYEE